MKTHTIADVESASVSMGHVAALIEELHNVRSVCWLCPGKLPIRGYCDACPDGYVYVPLKYVPILQMRGATFK